MRRRALVLAGLGLVLYVTFTASRPDPAPPADSAGAAGAAGAAATDGSHGRVRVDYYGELGESSSPGCRRAGVGGA